MTWNSHPDAEIDLGFTSDPHHAGMNIATKPAAASSLRELAIPGLVLVLAVHAALAVRLVMVSQPFGIDLAPVWTAARAAFQSPHAAYDFEAITRAQAWLIGDGAPPRPAPYPPTAFLLLAPLALLPFWWANSLLTIGSAAAAGLLTRRLAVPSSNLAMAMLLLAPPAVWGLLAGQVHLLIAALLVAAVSALSARPVLAGVLVGLAMAIKPSLLILAPVALLASGRWKAVFAAAATGGLAAIVSVGIFGLQMWLDWFASLPRFAELIAGNPNLAKMVISPAAIARSIGLSGWAAIAWMLGFAGAGAVMVWMAFRRERPACSRLAALSAGCLLATPYALNYDAALLAPVAAVMVALARTPRAWLRAGLAYLAIVLAGFASSAPYGLLLFVAVTCLPWPTHADDLRSG